MIKIEDLYKSFGYQKVLSGVNLNIEKAQTTVIIGRSGCGKSVLLKHIIGLLKPDKGKILVDGVDITNLNGKEMEKLRMKMAMVFQANALFDSLTVGENVAFGLLEHSNLNKDQIYKKVEEALENVGLAGCAGLMPYQLSGGMKKRVALARAICMDPEIILYDEPTTGVDPITADIINDLIIKLHNKLKVTSVVVTHDMKSAYKIADKIAMLFQGKIIFEGTPEDFKNTSHPIVYQFVNGLSTGPITEDLNIFK